MTEPTLYVHPADHPQTVVIETETGTRYPVHHTLAGRALLGEVERLGGRATVEITPGVTIR